MNIAIITPGILPVPPTKGGAVETLIEFYLKENERSKQHYFHVYGIYDENAFAQANQYQYSTFHCFKAQDISTKIKRSIYKYTHSPFYYNYYTDYYAYWVIQQMKKENIDRIVIENRYGFVLEIFQYFRIPILLHLHNDTLNKETWQGIEILDKFHKIITVSNYIKQQVNSISCNDKTTTVYNGIEIEKFTNPLKSISREQLGLTEDDFVVIYTGRITPIKGIKELLEAFILLKEYPTIKLLIVGGSDLGEERFFEEMKSKAQQIKNKVHFTGQIAYSEIPDILYLGDIAVIPSICEDALTLSAIENMAAGLPLVVTRSGGIPEAVGDAAIIIEKDSQLSCHLLHAILGLYQGREKRMQMTKKALIRASQFSTSAYAKQILQSFCE